MKRLFIAILAISIAAFALACSGSGNDPAPIQPTPTGTPTATPTPPPETPTEEPAPSPSPAPTTPPAGGGGTGVDAADRFIDARDDPGVIEALIRYSMVPCKLPSETDYWPHCADGAAPGTLVEAFPWWGCHGAFSNGGAPALIAQMFSERPGALVSVLSFSPAGTLDVFDPAATIAVIFEQPDQQGWAAILDVEGNFYGAVAGCPLDAAGLVAFHFGDAEVLFEA